MDKKTSEHSYETNPEAVGKSRNKTDEKTEKASRNDQTQLHSARPDEGKISETEITAVRTVSGPLVSPTVPVSAVSSAVPVPEHAQTYVPDKKRTAPKTPGHAKSSGFVIRKKPADTAGIVRTAAPDALLERYPALASVPDLCERTQPLLFLTEETERTIKQHIEWGQRTVRNIREQGGILIGRPVRTGHCLIGIAEHAIPAELSQSNAAYLQMGTESWTKMLEIFDERYSGQNLYVIGWFHTHPNSLPVFMSGTDMGTQRAFFNQPWHFAVVLNPHRKLLACFHSARADRCECCPPNFTDPEAKNKRHRRLR